MDFNVNFCQFTVADCLDFVSYCAFRCNGTILIAEIHRLVMSDRNKYREVLKDSGSMYQFLCDVNAQITTKSTGSCTSNRYTHSQGSNDTKWNTRQKDLLALCLLFHETKSICSRQDKIFSVVSEIMDTLEKCKTTFKGVGGMGANEFIHLSALTGLIPLCAYNYAELKSLTLGPAKMIKKVNKNKESIKKSKTKVNLSFCQSVFQEMVKDLRRIWGALITLAVLENLLCEVFRCIQRTTGNMSSKDEYYRVDGVVDMPSSDVKDSTKKDLLFYDDQRHCLQNMFLVTTVSKQGSGLHPQLIMKQSSCWNDGSTNWLKSITNWEKDKKDKKLMCWNRRGEKLSLSSKLIVSNELREMMGLTE